MDRSNRLAAAKRGGARAHHPRSHREVETQAGDRQAPRAGARAGAAGPQPGGSHAAQVQLQQLQPARHPELHRDAPRGINIQYDQQYRDVPYTVTLDGVPLEEALQQILSVNGFFYKVMNQRTILVAPDTPASHLKYDDMVMQVFYLSHADAQELSQVVNTMMRLQGQTAPAIYPGKTSNTLTVRAPAPHRRGRRTADPRARQAARRGRDRGPDPGGQPEPREGVWYQPQRLCHRAHVLAGGCAAQYTGAHAADAAAAVQPEHDLAGHQHRGLLSLGADDGAAVPRDRLAHEAAGKAAAARRGRAGAHAQPRRRDSCRVYCLRRCSGRRVREHSAILVYLSDRLASTSR